MPNIRKHVEKKIFLSLTGKRSKNCLSFSYHLLILYFFLNFYQLLHFLMPYACMCLTRNLYFFLLKWWWWWCWWWGFENFFFSVPHLAWWTSNKSSASVWNDDVENEKKWKSFCYGYKSRHEREKTILLDAWLIRLGNGKFSKKRVYGNDNFLLVSYVKRKRNGKFFWSFVVRSKKRIYVWNRV